MAISIMQKIWEHLGHYSKIILNKTQFLNSFYIFKNYVMNYINSIMFRIKQLFTLSIRTLLKVKGLRIFS